jgi:hypothetical protein
MSIDRIVFALAGVMVLSGLALGHWVSAWWLVLPAFVGFNMLQAAFTRFCPLAMMLKKLGARPGAAFE